MAYLRAESLFLLLNRNGSTLNNKCSAQKLVYDIMKLVKSHSINHIFSTISSDFLDHNFIHLFPLEVPTSLELGLACEGCHVRFLW